MTAPRSELGRYWPVVLTGALGLSVGMSATMAFSLGSFIVPLQAQFGWGRADISLAFTALTLGIFLSAPLAGRLCDRHGAALVGAASLCAFSAVTLATAAFVSRIEMFWLAYLAMAITGAGTTPVVMVRPAAAVFRRSRGLALGLILTGAGLAAFWVPQLVTAVTGFAGWRAAYCALAAIALAAAPLVWFGFRAIGPEQSERAGEAVSEVGLTLREARRTPQFWMMSAMAFLMAMGMTGVVIHCVPLLRDHGLDPTQAARIAAMIGLASVAGRVTIGVLLDRLPALFVAIAIFCVAALGILMLRDNLLPIVAVIAIGLAYGAEVDLLAYLSAHYFGRRSFSAIYGWQYSIFALGSGLSPYWIGRLYELRGAYDLPLLICAGLAMMAAMIAVSLKLVGATRREGYATV